MIVLIKLIFLIVTITSELNLTAVTKIRYNLLNYGQTISVPLSLYLNVNVPGEIKINKVHSDNLDALSYNITTKPMTTISSIKLNATFANGTVYTFNNSQVLQTCSIYKQPNKIFLMKNNIIVQIRYQFSPSNQPSSMNVIEINGDFGCSEISKMEYNSSYYIIVGCMNSSFSFVNLYKFNTTSSNTIEGLYFINQINININNCVRLTMYSFQSLLLNSNNYYQSVLFFCGETFNHKVSKLFVLSVKNYKGLQTLISTEIVQPTTAITVFKNCLVDCKWIQTYQKGVMILRNDSLYYFKYDKANNVTRCDSISTPAGIQFIDSVQDQGIQYIYLIFNDKIIIKQSYSPNFQTIQFQRINNSTLTSFAIARKFLTLFFTNNTHNCILVYDLVKVYPKQVDRIITLLNQTNIAAYSVNNFLESGNYFFIYNQSTNELSLNFYQGYQFVFRTMNSSVKAPYAKVNISNNENQQLIIEAIMRDFNDLSINQVSGSNLTYKGSLIINLTSYIQGPLGKFYNYPNNISAFQYINQYSQINISSYLKKYGQPLTVSFNNYLNAAVINFYYSSQTNTCELNFNYDTKQVRLSLCKTLTRKKLALQVAKEIVVLSQDKYIQYNQTLIQYCSLSSNNQFQCLNIPITQIINFSKIKLVSYLYDSSTDQIIQMIIHNSTDIIFCCLQRNVYHQSKFNITIHYHASYRNLPILATWKIQQLLCDKGYQQFLVLHLKGIDNTHMLMIFDKPTTDQNSISFIGHIIQSYNFTNLQAIFCINHLLVCIYQVNSVWTIQQYKITKYYIVKQTKKYPLYHFNIVINGNHQQDYNFIYVEADQFGKAIYLVYSPLENSFNVLSHKFDKKGSLQLVFAQQLGDDNNNSMAINGDWLLGLASPSLMFKFINPTSLLPSMGRYIFEASVLDTTNKLTILSYEFAYNQGEQSIRFDGDPQISIQFNESSSFSRYQIDPLNIVGPANDYRLSIPDDDSCNFFTVQSRDISTKQGCLAYSNPNQFGTLYDFLAITVSQGINVELLITEKQILSVINRKFAKRRTDISGLTNCKFQKSYSKIIMICDNSTTIGKIMFNVTVFANSSSYRLNLTKIELPTWLAYQDFQIQLSEDYLIFQVPIRYKQNCIYYKAILDNNKISNQTYSLLVGASNRSQFETVDTSIYESLYFILDKQGIGIYNLNDSSSQMMPAIWIPQAMLNIPSNDGALVYLQCLSAKTSSKNQSIKQIIIQIGMERSAYEVMIQVQNSPISTINQTVYTQNNNSNEILYQYKQYMSCHNNEQSRSQKYQNLIVKICNYQPADELVFANFISVTNQTTGPLIQFYNRGGTSSYPFRVDTINANFFSHHSFVIRNNTLVVASLFNLLCYYALSTTLSWQFTYVNKNKTIFDPQKERSDKLCTGSLMISNIHFNKQLTFSILLDNDLYAQQYWTNGTYYIQRVIVFLILLNTIRLWIKAKRSNNRIRLRKKLTGGRLHTSKFEVMVKINSKMTN